MQENHQISDFLAKNDFCNKITNKPRCYNYSVQLENFLLRLELVKKFSVVVVVVGGGWC